MSSKKKAKVPPMRGKSPIVKRSIVIKGHKTSVSLEDPFWRRLKLEAGTREITLSSLVGEIDDKRVDRAVANLSSTLRLHVVDGLERELSRGARA